MTNQEEKEMQLTVPYIMHEAAQARSERAIKRLTIGIIVVSILSIIIAFLTGYFIDKCWRDYFSECEVENYSLSTDGGGNSVRATQNIIYRASEQLFKHVKF